MADGTAGADCIIDGRGRQLFALYQGRPALLESGSHAFRNDDDMAELFNVVFAGEIAGRADPAVVRANVGKLFNASEAVLDKLFSGQPVAIKKMVDRATAMQLRARLKQVGAEARIVQVDEQGRPLAAPAPASPAAAAPAPARATAPSSAPAPGAAPSVRPTPAPAPSGPAAAPAAAGSMASRLQAMAASAPAAPSPAPAAAGAAAPAGDWGIKPVGTRLSDPPPPPPPAPDTSALSLAKASGNLVAPEELPRPAPVQVDISGLSMAAAGTEVLREDERVEVVPVQVDISALSMAAAGTELEELREHRPPVNPDISYLKLAE